MLTMVVSAAAALLSTAALAAAMVGQPAPDFSAVDTNGKTHRLADYKGKYVVLEWVNPGCPFVRKHYSGNMQATQKEIVGKGAVWLAVNSTAESQSDYLPPAKMEAWMKEKNALVTATLMDADGKIGKAYGAKTTPHMYIIDPQGTLVYAGAIDSIPSARVEDIDKATNYVKQAFGELMAGKPVSVATTTAYGCTVKYAN
ncbi:MAG: thioredoxin family protein [Burkholderiales bacterium]|nr:thioredoxin family protein [Burkholderiales bacterium]